MPNLEYKVIPAPERARKVRGLKGPALFAHAIEEMINELAADGWVYLRTDTLPQEERSGLTSKTTNYRNLLVFQREVPNEVTVQPVEATPAHEPVPAPAPGPTPDAPPDPELEEEITNIWQTHEEEKPKRLVADRQGKRVDL